MSTQIPIPTEPRQLLPRIAYTSQDWLDLEQEHLFSNIWSFACVTVELPKAGDYVTLNAGAYPLAVVRGKDGALRAFHNICRHRGTELFEGSGNTETAIICPYHRWVFELDGRLRGLPNQKECFPTLDKTEMGLFEASIGIFNDLVFVHPKAKPEPSFDAWLSTLPNATWPHDLSSGDYEPTEEIIYEMKCNWKVFYENAVDGYHLAYLHDKTLGPLTPSANIWIEHGQHLAWYSTERQGEPNALPELVESQAEQAKTRKIPEAEKADYGGVYMLFPTTIVTPNPYGISISQLIPVSPGVTHLKARNWAPKGQSRYGGTKDIPGYDPESGLIKSENWKQHPLETYDFQTEDVWICEKMQRSLGSPRYEVGALAAGPGAESTIAHFQQCLLACLPDNVGHKKVED